MINRHSCQAGTAVFVRVGGVWQQGRPEENRSLRQTAEMPVEISEAHLPVGMDPNRPHAPFPGTPLDCVVAQSAARALFTANPALTAMLAVSATRSRSLIVQHSFN